MTNLPEKHDETVDLHDYADDGPSEEDDGDAAEEGRRALDLLPLEEEAEGALKADHQNQTQHKQNLWRKSGFFEDKCRIMRESGAD